MIDMILSFKLNDYTSVHRDGICYGEGKKRNSLYKKRSCIMSFKE